MTMWLYWIAAVGVALVVIYLGMAVLFWVSEQRPTYFDRIL